MLERDLKYGTCRWECDTCGKDIENDGVRRTDDFNSAWANLRQEGWQAWQTGSTWSHKCPDCSKKTTPHRFFERPQ